MKNSPVLCRLWRGGGPKENMAVTLEHMKPKEVSHLGPEATDPQANRADKGLAELVNDRAGLADKPPFDMCPECGTRMQPEGRCLTCPACGFSRCGT